MQMFSSPQRFLAIAGLLVGLMAFLGGAPAYAQSCDIFVDTSNGGTGSGTQADPYSDLQDGLDDATGGEVVCVAEGTYNPPKSNSPFSVTGGSTLRGGYPSGFSSTTQDVDGNPTVLDGANVQQGSSAKRVLTLGSFGGTTVIDGLTIKNGDGNPGAGFSPGGYFSDTVTFRDVDFASNNAGNDDGGAVYFDGDGTLNLIRVEFRNNISGQGGALFVTPDGFTLNIENSIFVGNESSGGGGAIKTEGGTINMENVLMSGNLAAANGGGFYFDYPNGGSLINVTITGNQAQGEGGGFYVGTNNQIAFDNSIIWNNASGTGNDQVGIDYGGSNLLYRYSDIQGSGGSGAWDSYYGTDGGNNIDLNPIFLSPKQPSDAPTTAGDYRLGARSPAVDAGDDNAVTLSTDLDGENRIQDSAVDMGPYEGSESLPDPEILYVDQATGSDQNGGTSWDDAVATLQAALDQASSNTELWVADGVYYPDEGPNVSNGDVTVSFSLKDRVSIYGGFAGNESSRSERDPDANLVVLSGDLDQDDNTNSDGVVTSPSDQNNGSKNNPTNAYHVVDGSGVSSQTVVDGLTITAGSADDKKNQDERPDEVGGGVFINNGSPRLADVRIIGNRAKLDGGGIASYGGGGPVVSESVVESNNASRNGGGIYNAEGSGLRVRFIVLRSNTATDAGGGIYNMGSNIRFTNGTVEGNEATGGSSQGGGFYTFNSKGSTLTNLRIVGNRAADGGAWFSSYDTYTGTAVTIGNASFSGNYATNQGGAIRSEQEPIDLQNSILWGNGPDQISEWGNVTVTNSIVEGGSNSSDPLFISDPTLASSSPTTDGDLQLQPTSPAIDAGDQTLLPSDVSDIDDDGDTSEQLPLDLKGAERIRDSDVDMGAYEGGGLSLAVEGNYGTDGTDAGWRDIGVPVVGAQMSDITRGDGTPIRDVTPNVLVWEDDTSLTHGAYVQADNSTPVPLGRGVTVYLRDKKSTPVDPTFTFDVSSGLSVAGNQDVIVGNEQDPSGNSVPADDPLNTGSQFHFLANPYGVPYDLASLDLVGSGFSSAVQIWDLSNGTYTTFNPALEPKSGVVAWQAFFIERSTLDAGAKQLTFPKEGRLPDDSNTNDYFQSTKSSGDADPKILALNLFSRSNEGDFAVEDKAAQVIFHPEAEKGWEAFDASKWTPQKHSYATIGPVGLDRDGSPTMKAQESRPLSETESVEIPFGFKTHHFSGELKISLGKQDQFPNAWEVTLVDTKGTEDQSDDERHVLGSNSEGYQFVVDGAREEASGRKDRTKGGQSEHVRKPQPLEWELRTSSSSRKSDKKDDTPTARFLLQIDKGAALPVEMAGFNATIDHRQARLKWKTASETDNAGFYVEHKQVSDSTSSNSEWSTLGFVEGSGTTTGHESYQYRTDRLTPGRHVFRLRQVDTDGDVHFTESVTLRSRVKSTVLSGPSPNPVRGQAQLTVTVRRTQEVTVQLYDVLGRKVRTITSERIPAQEPHTIRLQGQGLSSGTYFLRVKGDTFQRTSRFTVVR